MVVLNTVDSTQVLGRPGYGRVGKGLKIFSNHFKVNVQAPSTIFQYHVDISYDDVGKRASKGLPPLPEKGSQGKDQADVKAVPVNVAYNAIDQVMKENREIFCSPIAYDGKTLLFSTDKLRFVNRKEFFLTLESEEGVDLFLKICFNETDKVIRMNEVLNRMLGKTSSVGYSYEEDNESLQCFDIALRHSAAVQFTSIGRSLFNSLNAEHLAPGADCWFGYFQSLRPTQCGLTLNIDSAACVFVKSQHALDLVEEVCRGMPRELHGREWFQVNDAVRGVKVGITHRKEKRSYRVNGLTKLSAQELRFKKEDGSEQSVEMYFSRELGVKLEFPNLPCLHVGNPKGHIYLPLEVCFVKPGQKLPRKATEEMTSKMIKLCAAKPEVRFREVKRLAKANMELKKGSLSSQFGISFNPEPIECQARILPAPQINYGNSVSVPGGSQGTWDPPKRANAQLFEPADIRSYGIVNLSKLNHGEVTRYVKDLMRTLQNFGCRVPSEGSGTPNVASYNNKNRGNVRTLFSDALHAGRDKFSCDPVIVFCFKQDMKADEYQEIKYCSDSVFGVVSQCITFKIAKKGGACHENIALKVNAKLCGTSYTVGGMPPQVQQVPTMILGADVNHPEVGSDSPSVASVVGSYNRAFSRYATSCVAQTSRVEQIERFGSMFIELFKKFYDFNNQTFPEHILYYRDGVGEGMFNLIIDSEIEQLRNAIKSIRSDWDPKITFVVVQKRHHTRFFCNQRNGTDRSGNCLPGTIVDTQICSPTQFDFYLQSHAGIQGTSRPAHYYVLLDEIGFSVDEIQQLTNNLCWGFSRCARAVSYVRPAYYAHLACKRGRDILAGKRMSEKRGGGGRDSRKNAQKKPKISEIELCDDITDTLFYS
eukprot:Nk52_evm35s1073 gene=Nk52_evmTU35s1073